MGGGQSVVSVVVAGVAVAKQLKDYFSTQAKTTPISKKALTQAQDILQNKVVLSQFKEDCLYDLTEGLKLDALERYCDVHIDGMDLKDEKNKRTLRNYLLMAKDLDKWNHKWEKLDFTDDEFFHYKGFIYMQREDDKVTIGYCIVNVFMKIKGGDKGLSFEEIRLIKDTYLYYKALEQLRKQDMIVQIPMIA